MDGEMDKEMDEKTREKEPASLVKPILHSLRPISAG